jgi:hypothetical protein
MPLHALTALADSIVVDAALEYLKSGVMGAAVVALASVIVVLWRDKKKEDKAHTDAIEKLHKDHLEAIEKIQSARVLDAQAVTAQMLKLSDTCTAALTNVTGSLNAQREMNSDVKDALGDLIDEMRRRGMGR